jgi:hypothetical protein
VWVGAQPNRSAERWPSRNVKARTAADYLLSSALLVRRYGLFQTDFVDYATRGRAWLAGSADQVA